MTKNRILIVEDDRDIAEGIGLNLELSDYAYLIIDDGTAVVEHLQHDSSFDLALLDIMLPGLDGFALMSYMQQYNIPVLYLSAKSDIPSRVRGLRDGAEDYIVKPFSMLELLVRMEKILDRNGKLNKILRFLDITLDIEKRTVVRSGNVIPLQPLEFELLAKLMRYQNCTLPRERLLNEIWGIDFAGGTRTVDIHVAHLRKKLGLENAILTVSKVGYRLEDGR